MPSGFRFGGLKVVLAGSLLWGCGSDVSSATVEETTTVDQSVLAAPTSTTTAIQPQSLSVYGLEVTLSRSAKPNAPAHLGELCIEGVGECLEVRLTRLWGAEEPAYWTSHFAHQTFSSIEELTKSLLWSSGILVRGHVVQVEERTPEVGPSSVLLTIDWGAIPPLTVTRQGAHTWVVPGASTGPFRSVLEAADAYLASFPPGDE